MICLYFLLSFSYCYFPFLLYLLFEFVIFFPQHFLLFSKNSSPQRFSVDDALRPVLPSVVGCKKTKPLILGSRETEISIADEAPLRVTLFLIHFAVVVLVSFEGLFLSNMCLPQELSFFTPVHLPSLIPQIYECAKRHQKCLCDVFVSWQQEKSNTLHQMTNRQAPYPLFTSLLSLSLHPHSTVTGTAASLLFVLPPFPHTPPFLLLTALTREREG